MVSAAAEGLGARAMCADFGCQVDIVLNVDASAAIGVAQRKGIGKLRHLNTQALRIQDAVREQRVSLLKVAGPENPADSMTKHSDSKSLNNMFLKMGLDNVSGRRSLAPQVTISGDMRSQAHTCDIDERIPVSSADMFESHAFGVCYCDRFCECHTVDIESFKCLDNPDPISLQEGSRRSITLGV